MLPPEGLVLAEEVGCVALDFGDAMAGLRAAGLLAPPWLWASLGSTGEAAVKRHPLLVLWRHENWST